VKKRIRAAIWDLDGTMIDSGEPGIERFLAVAHTRGLLDSVSGETASAISSELKLMWGKPGTSFVQRFWPDADPNAFYAAWEEYDLRHPYRALQGIKDAVAQLHSPRRLYQAVATSRRRRTAMPQVSFICVEQYLSRIVCGDDTPYKKPDPRVLSGIADDLKAKRIAYPKQVVIIGDTLEGDYQLAVDSGAIPLIVLEGSMTTREEFLSAGVPEANIVSSSSDIVPWIDNYNG